jgi:hypothetical protein
MIDDVTIETEGGRNYLILVGDFVDEFAAYMENEAARLRLLIPYNQLFELYKEAGKALDGSN